MQSRPQSLKVFPLFPILRISIGNKVTVRFFLKGFESHVPNVPTVLTVLSQIQPPGDQSEIENTQRELRRSKVLNLLEGKRFALLIEDGSTDPVIATIGIQNLAIFELAIPQHSYDGIALLELIEKHYGDNYAGR